MPGDVIKQNFRKSSLLLVLKRIEDRAGLMRNKNLVCGDRTPSSISTRMVLKYKVQSVTKYLRLTLISWTIGHHGKSLNAIFWDFFASTSKIFILAGVLDIRLSFYEV